MLFTQVEDVDNRQEVVKNGLTKMIGTYLAIAATGSMSSTTKSTRFCPLVLGHLPLSPLVS